MVRCGGSMARTVPSTSPRLPGPPCKELQPAGRQRYGCGDRKQGDEHRFKLHGLRLSQRIGRGSRAQPTPPGRPAKPTKKADEKADEKPRYRRRGASKKPRGAPARATRWLTLREPRQGIGFFNTTLYFCQINMCSFTRRKPRLVDVARA